MGTICSVHWIHFIILVGVHEYSTYSVECRVLYRVWIHYAVYAQRKIYKHHVRLVRLYEYITM